MTGDPGAAVLRLIIASERGADGQAALEQVAAEAGLVTAGDWQALVMVAIGIAKAWCLAAGRNPAVEAERRLRWDVN